MKTVSYWRWLVAALLMFAAAVMPAKAGAVSFTNYPDRVLFNNSDGAWYINKGCRINALTGKEQGPGYIAFAVTQTDGMARTILNDPGFESNKPPVGLGKFNWKHHRQDNGYGNVNVDNTWPFGNADHDGCFNLHGVQSVTIHDGPRIESGVGIFDLSVHFGDPWTNDFVVVWYKWRFHDSDIRMYAWVVEKDGIGDPNGFVKGPQFVAGVNGKAGANKWDTVHTYDVGGNIDCTWTAGPSDPTTKTGQCPDPNDPTPDSADDRVRWRLDYTQQGLTCGLSNKCFNVVMRAYPGAVAPSWDNFRTDLSSRQWERNGVDGLDRWAELAAGRSQAGDPGCSVGYQGGNVTVTSPDHDAVRRWETASVSTNNRFDYAAGQFFGWQDCNVLESAPALFRDYGPLDENWGVYASFSLGDGWIIQ